MISVSADTDPDFLAAVNQMVAQNIAGRGAPDRVKITIQNTSVYFQGPVSFLDSTDLERLCGWPVRVWYHDLTSFLVCYQKPNRD